MQPPGATSAEALERPQTATRKADCDGQCCETVYQLLAGVGGAAAVMNGRRTGRIDARHDECAHGREIVSRQEVICSPRFR
jgi:hypothetical protein